MLFTEFNEQEHDKNVFEDGREAGIKQGIQQGIQNGKVLILAKLISKGKITYQEALSDYPEIKAEELDPALKKEQTTLLTDKLVACINRNHFEVTDCTIDEPSQDCVTMKIIMKYRKNHSAMPFAGIDEEEREKYIYEDGMEEGIQIGKTLVLADWIANGGLSYQEAHSKYPEITAEQLSWVTDKSTW